MKKQKLLYVTPSIKVVEFKVENGFLQSGQPTSIPIEPSSVSYQRDNTNNWGWNWTPTTSSNN